MYKYPRFPGCACCKDSLPSRLYIARLSFSFSKLRLSLFWDKVIAAAPTATTPIAKMINVMLTIQSGSSPIDIAQKAQARLFAVYVVVLVGGALLAALFTVLLWHATNKYQDTVRYEANARIVEATASAAQANERTEKLEHENLELRKNVAVLEERAASAEHDLLGLQNRFKPRRLSDAHKDVLGILLNRWPETSVGFTVPIGDKEAIGLRNELACVLHDAGWNVDIGAQTVAVIPEGIMLLIPEDEAKGEAPRPSTQCLETALRALGFEPFSIGRNSGGEPHRVICIGSKPEM
jgi:hypothetical protein